MAVPDFQSMLLPFLKLLGDGKPHQLQEAVDHVARVFSLSAQDQAEALQSGQTRLYNRVGWTRTYLKKAGLIESVGLGRFQITGPGRDLLATNPQSLDAAFLEGLVPGMWGPRYTTVGEDPATYDAATRTWSSRDGVKERLRAKLRLDVADEALLSQALGFLAAVVQNADEERSSAWYVRETQHGLRINAGRLLACELYRSKIRVSVVGPIPQETMTALSAEVEEEFKKIPGGLLIGFPVEHAEKAASLLSVALNEFVDEAMARVRRVVSLEDHVPEAIALIGEAVGRELPQPTPLAAGSVDDEDQDDDPAVVSRDPKIRGRAPIFEHAQRSISSLISDIERDVIALPDLQRPFVWEDTKIRDLLDSLFLGFPVGTLVLWHPPADKDARAVAADRPGLKATTLVIDGQQRLTSLYAVMQGEDVVGKDGTPRRITIAFRPRDGRFEVADAAIRNDPEFLPNVTDLWKGTKSKPQIRRELLTALRDKGRAVDDAYEDAVERNLDRAHSIGDYRFPTVDIRKTNNSEDGEVTEEDVAEIFVRINNQGTRLGQADFVLTLLSVFHGELRDRIETRALAMSDESMIAVDTQQLLRAACAVAFGRARMSAVYKYLRGVDPTTGATDKTKRVELLTQLDGAAQECMQPTTWRDFLLRVKHAGFVAEGLIASKSAIINAYALYIRGRRAGVEKAVLDEAMAGWTFGTLLQGRYSASSETIFEQDLARVSGPGFTAGQFVAGLDAALKETFTADYWTHTVVTALNTQKARAPAALAFRAAQVVLGARALFSDQSVQHFLDPPASGSRAASEAHHLFPIAWLESHGVADRREINQVANLAIVGWYENSVIGARAPAKYVAELRKKLKITDEAWARQCAEHALPVGWEAMDYREFLAERRRRMAEIIHVAYRKLGGEADVAPLQPPWFLPGSEAVWSRIAEAERALRGAVREAYRTQFGDRAAVKIEEALPPAAREALGRSLRARPAGADPLTVVDYLYLGQLPALLFANEIWPRVKASFDGVQEPKPRLQAAVSQIAPVRNEIAHVREVDQSRLLRTAAACEELIELARRATAP